MGKSASNEQRKLTATYMNGIAIAFMAVGVLAPVASIANGGSGNLLGLVVLAIGCVLVSASLHYLARQLLEGIED